MAQDQLVAGPGHRDVEQAPLLLEVAVALGQDLVDQLDRQRERLAPRPRREIDRRRGRAGTRPGTRGPSPCGPSSRGPRRRPGPGRRVAGSSPASISVARCRARKTARSSARSADWPRMRSKKRLMLASCSSAATLWPAGKLAEPAGVPEERVEDLACGPPLGELLVAPQVVGQARQRGATAGCETEDRWLILQLLEDLEDAPVPAPRRSGHLAEVGGRDGVAIRGRERVDVDARRGVRDGAKQREQESHLGPGVQPGGAGEPPRQPRGGQRSEDRVRVRVRAHEDGEVPRPWRPRPTRRRISPAIQSASSPVVGKGVVPDRRRHRGPNARR